VEKRGECGWVGVCGCGRRSSTSGVIDMIIFDNLDWFGRRFEKGFLCGNKYSKKRKFGNSQSQCNDFTREWE